MTTIDREPIAIIGMGCRFPGANNTTEFWQLMRDGVDAITEVPVNRSGLEAFCDLNLALPDAALAGWGGFLAQVDRFDPQFFGISAREAESMDPQQRLLLEVAWEAFEDAGLVPERLAGTPTGVFIGISSHDYSHLVWGDPPDNPYAATGTGNSIAANRISYAFDLVGPSMAIDTACSSSLVAVHLACQSLWAQESNLALAGGVNLLLSPKATVNMAKAGLISPDGRCKAFDADANGYVRSEGAGIVVLKPLAQAQVDGDPIYAVILGTAVNQDGRSNGLTAPNPQALEAVARAAYQRAGVSPGQVQYVEAQGTSTKLGDSMEMKALGAVLIEDRPSGEHCAVGSVKTNIGHPEAAAGIAGLIKVVLAIKHQQIPPNLHFQTPNPHIPFDLLGLRVQKSLDPWLDRSSPRLAGVNSFGFGGTNAHVVVAESPVRISRASIVDRPLHLFTLSAKSKEALQELAHRYRAYLSNHPTAAIADICFTANTGRSHFNHRLAVIATSTEQLSERLQAFIDGQQIDGLASAKVSGWKPPRLEYPDAGMSYQLLPDETGIILPSLRQGRLDWQSMLQSLAELYVRGVPVDWTGFDRDYSRQRVSLPSYPFQRQRYWVEPAAKHPYQNVEKRSPQMAQSPNVNLQREHIEQLSQYLETTGELSEDEMKLLPKLLQLLHQQASISSTQDFLTKPTSVTYPRPELKQDFILPRHTLELNLARIWEETLGVAPIGVRDNFFELGGDSLLATSLVALIQQQLGSNLSLAVLLESPTVEQLASVIVQQPDAMSWSPLVAIQPGGSKRPFFCVPGAGGNAIYFYHLARYLGSDRPFYGLQAWGLDGESEPFTRIEDIAAYYITAIQTVQPQGPYLLGGHCFGYYVVFEMAQQLQKQGYKVALLVSLDAPALVAGNPDNLDIDNAIWVAQLSRTIERLFGKNLKVSYDVLQTLDSDEQVNYLKERLKMVDLLPLKADAKQVRGILRVLKAEYQAGSRYALRKLPRTQMTLFRAGEVAPENVNDMPAKVRQDPAYGWQQIFAERVEVRAVSGNHLTMMVEPHVKDLATQLKICLDRMQVDTNF